MQIFTVDAFTDRPFGGNPAAIVPLTKTLDDTTLQKIAAELNLSETAYLRPLENTQNPNWEDCGRFSLRWFCPVSEIPLCGHATLASAHALFNCLGNKKTQLEFETLSGILKVKRDGDQLVMDFPANPPEVLNINQKQLLIPLVDAAAANLKSKVKDVKLCHKNKYLMVRLEDSVGREGLESIAPNFSEMEKAHDGSLVKGIIVTVAGGSSNYSLFSRFFAPLYGVNEDPVTGSAHTILGPYWAAELGTKELSCRQCSARGGDVRVSILDGGRVTLAGSATTVIKGTINI